MSEQRWEELVEFAKESMYYFNDGYITEDEINLIVSVLKNNIPFDVVGEN